MSTPEENIFTTAEQSAPVETVPDPETVTAAPVEATTQRAPSPARDLPDTGADTASTLGTGDSVAAHTYPPIPLRRVGVPATGGDHLRAAEEARADEARTLTEWLDVGVVGTEQDIQRRSAAMDEWVRRATSTPELLTDVISSAQRRATQQAEEMRVRYERRTDSRAHSLMDGAAAIGRSTSAWTDVKPSEEFRNALRRLEFHDDPQGNPPLTLDLARDVLRALQRQIGELRTGTDGLPIEQADLEFMQRKTHRDIETLISAIGETAYDKTDWKRAQSTMAVAATLLVGVLPFAYAYYSEPTAFFYLGSLAGAYSRTLALATGLMLNPATAKEQVWDHVRERQLIWAMPALFYSVQAYMQAYASDHPDDRAAAHVAERASAFARSPGFLSAVAVAEFAIFVATNHPDLMQAGFRKTEEFFKGLTGAELSQSTRFNNGNMRVPTPPEGTPAAYLHQLADIRNTFRLAVGLTDSLFQASDTWQGNLSAGQRAAANRDRMRQARGEPLTDAEEANLREARGDFEKLGEAQKAKHTQTRQAMGQLTETLEQFIGGIKDAVPMITGPQKREKQLIGTGLLATGLALGTITSLAALKTPALLTDYIPYYVATELLLGVQMSKDTLTRDNLVRTFGSYFGGTTMALPTSLANLVTNLAFKEGLWDLATPKELPGTHHPSLPVEQHRQLYAADGKVNFGIFVAYNVVTALAAGGAAGQWISNAVINRFAQAADLNQQSELLSEDNRRQILDLCTAYRARHQQQLPQVESPESRFQELPPSPTAHPAPLSDGLSQSPSAPGQSTPPIGSTSALPSQPSTSKARTSELPGILPQGELSRQLNEAGITLPFGREGVQGAIRGFNDCGLNAVLALDPTLQEAYRNRQNNPGAFQNGVIELAQQLADTRNNDAIRYDGIEEQHLTRLLNRRGIDVHVITGSDPTTVATQLADANGRQERLFLTTGQESLALGGQTIARHHFVPIVPAGEGQWVLLDPVRRRDGQAEVRVTTEQLTAVLSAPGHALSRASPRLQLGMAPGTSGVEPSQPSQSAAQESSVSAVQPPSPTRTRTQSDTTETPVRGREPRQRPGSERRSTPPPRKSTSPGPHR